MFSHLHRIPSILGMIMCSTNALHHQAFNMRTVALLRSVSQDWPELDMNFEISKSEHLETCQRVRLDG
jgi:hypothetical protein